MSTALDFTDFNAEGGKFTWINTHSKPCNEPDGGCEARDGESRTLDEWTEAGLPRTGWSACGGNCKCGLVPAFDFTFGITETLDEDGELGATVASTPPEETDARKPFDRFVAVTREELKAWHADSYYVGELAEEIEEIMADLEAGLLRPDEARDAILDATAGAGEPPPDEEP